MRSLAQVTKTNMGEIVIRIFKYNQQRKKRKAQAKSKDVGKKPQRNLKTRKLREAFAEYVTVAFFNVKSSYERTRKTFTLLGSKTKDKRICRRGNKS
jgi:hypothetical protein